MKALQGSRFHQLITDQTEVSTKTEWRLFLSRAPPPPPPPAPLSVLTAQQPSTWPFFNILPLRWAGVTKRSSKNGIFSCVHLPYPETNCRTRKVKTHDIINGHMAMQNWPKSLLSQGLGIWGCKSGQVFYKHSTIWIVRMKPLTSLAGDILS